MGTNERGWHQKTHQWMSDWPCNMNIVNDWTFFRCRLRTRDKTSKHIAQLIIYIKHFFLSTTKQKSIAETKISHRILDVDLAFKFTDRQTFVNIFVFFASERHDKLKWQVTPQINSGINKKLKMFYWWRSENSGMLIDDYWFNYLQCAGQLTERNY